jgi:hypothetical protein
MHIFKWEAQVNKIIESNSSRNNFFYFFNMDAIFIHLHKKWQIGDV